MHLLNELGSRRRSNILFRNEQSLDRGVQISHVNVGVGNLTFARRDLVVVGRIPLVFARVYDSVAASTADFGPGWRIASAESIQIAGRQLRLVDESGSTVIFQAAGDNRYEPVEHHASPVLRVLKTASGDLIAHLQGGWLRTFRLDSKVYRLVEVADRFGNAVSLRYQEGRLLEIAGPNGRSLRILRSADGRISAVEDNSGRGVRYQYDTEGRLVSVFDAGGNEWKYAYDQKHRLASMTNPEGFQELSAQYDRGGRVRQIFANGLTRTFKYKGDRKTEVRDSVMGEAQFTQDKHGVTIGVRNFAGARTSVELDDDRQLVELHGDSGVTAEFDYKDGRLKTARVHTGTTARQMNYNYDVEGRLTGIAGVLSDAQSAPSERIHLEYDARGALSSRSGTGQQRSYGYSVSGDVTQLVLNGATYTFASDVDGQITASVDASGKHLGFAYRSDGKLERTTYWDGTAVAYEYDALGTRSFGDWADQGSVSYTYGRSGNVSDILITSGIGQVGGHTIETDAQQRVMSVDYHDGKSLTVSYDAASNPQRIVTSAGDDLRYEYDASNRLQRVVGNGSEVLKYVYAPSEPDLRTQSDHKTMRTSLPVRRASVAFGSSFEIMQTRTRGTPLAVVVFDEELVAFRLVTPMAVVLDDVSVYDGLKRMRLIRSGRDGHADKDRFEQPSNVLFLPPEYVSINCCIPCPPPGHILCGRCVWQNGEPIECYCSPPTPPPPSCARPINFRQTLVRDAGGGNLEFEYYWDSSTGNLNQLSTCSIGEKVDYPGIGSPYMRPSPPFPPGGHANPTEIEIGASSGALGDVHFVPPGNFVKPYVASSYTGSQIYRYKCPCAYGGTWVKILGPLQINRSVSQNPNGTWKYTVTKPIGGQAGINPLP